MLKLEVVAKVYYTCTLTENDEKIVREYAKENDLELEKAAEILYFDGDINVYDGDVTESDCDTQEINKSEFHVEQ